MIEYIKFTDLKDVPNNYTNSVKAIKRRLNKEIKFKEGINVLLAPNGTGKSTVITNIAKYFFCYHTGLISLDYESINDVIHKTFDEGKYMYLKNGMEISSDGNVCFISPTCCNGTFSLSNTFMTPEDFAQVYYDRNSSSGEANFNNFVRVFRRIKNLDFNQFRKDSINELMEYKSNIYGDYREIFKYIDTPNLPPSKPTILIDELDSNMDIINSIYLFKSLIQLSKKFQIIMASHSSIIFDIKDINIIELKRGYKKECLNELNLLRGNI